MDVYFEEIVLFNERIINMIKSMGDIMVLYPINTKISQTFLVAIKQGGSLEPKRGEVKKNLK